MNTKNSHKKILIIEDDATLAQMYGERLTHEGYSVVWCKNGAKAVQTVISEDPDLVLLDLLLPGKGGLGILQILRTLPKTKHLPVVILTSYPEQEYINTATRWKASAFFSKTGTMPQTIVSTINKLLASSQSTISYVK